MLPAVQAPAQYHSAVLPEAEQPAQRRFIHQLRVMTSSMPLKLL
jgi:hypothetical protein